MRYAWSYDVPSDQVKLAPKPHDCDFWSAPMGRKHCSYVPAVSSYNAAGQSVGGKTKTGVSWKLERGDPVYHDIKPQRVQVDWVKMAD